MAYPLRFDGAHATVRVVRDARHEPDAGLETGHRRDEVGVRLGQSGRCGHEAPARDPDGLAGRDSGGHEAREQLVRVNLVSVQGGGDEGELVLLLDREGHPLCAAATLAALRPRDGELRPGPTLWVFHAGCRWMESMANRAQEPRWATAVDGHHVVLPDAQLLPLVFAPLKHLGQVFGLPIHRGRHLPVGKGLGLRLDAEALGDAGDLDGAGGSHELLLNL